MVKEQQNEIEREIARARDGIGERIDELDRSLRTKFDVKSVAKEHAPQIIAGGAVVGFLVGFGMPGLVKTGLKIGLPLALISLVVAKSRS